MGAGVKQTHRGAGPQEGPEVTRVPKVEGVGRKVQWGPGALPPTHLPVGAILQIVLVGRHAQGGLVYLQVQT